MKELLVHLAQLNAALDLDKNETQVALAEEDDIGISASALRRPSLESCGILRPT